MSTLEYIKLVCGGGLMCLFQLVMTAISIAYLVFAIIFLVKDYGVCGDASPLWVLVLVSIIAPIFLIRIQNQPSDNHSEENDRVTPFAAFLLVICEVVIGGILIYGKGTTCEDIKQTGLWVVALVLFWTLLFALFLVIAVFFVTCAVGLWCTDAQVTQTVVGVNPSSIRVTIVSSEEHV